jgi:glycosyltransferase involved in cell wall biosynthesis
MSNIAIVVVGYNRSKSIARLLNSLASADYKGADVPLIISIDNSGDNNVIKVAESFKWTFGEKVIIKHPQKLGLKNHILFCGNLTQKYDAVVVLEDDLFVSPHYYTYVCKTIQKYDCEEKIAGISLYTHLWNVCENRPFIPQKNEYDVYFQKYAQSWGQVWTKKMWSQFYNWYLKNSGPLKAEDDIPPNVINWPESSWLKYFIKYLVKTDRYFVYPYTSLSTNFTEVGTHNTQNNTSYQVPLLWEEKLDYKFPDFSLGTLKYDVYFELEDLGRFLGLNPNDVCIDLYGSKKNSERKRYWITSEKKPYKIIQSFGLQLRPHELNVLAKIDGSEIYLYDTLHSIEIKTKNKRLSRLNEVKRINYDIRAIPKKKLMKLLKFEVCQRIKGKVRWLK